MTRQLTRILLVIAALVVAASARTGSINGYVRDLTNGEPLAYANVYLEGTSIGAASNDRGYYYISNVPAGEYELAVSFIGFGTARRRVEVEVVVL